jgi:SAM-dependent methyltransferase
MISASERDEPTLRPASSESCPLCGGRSIFAFVAVDRNRRTTDESFSYRRCEVCSTIFMIDVPGDLSPYYEGDYYPFDAAGEPLWRSNPGLSAAEVWRVGALRTMVDPGRLIDVGAGAGGFVAAAQDGGFQVTALEMDGACCDYIRTHLGAEAIGTDDPLTSLRALPAARVVTLWHVLEHLREPADMIGVAAESLEPGGVLAIAVPSPDSLQFKLLRTRWAHLDAPRHLCLMPRDAIVRRAREVGLELIGGTTIDPSGVACTLHGWVAALWDFSRGPAPGTVMWAGAHIADALAPVERRGTLGAALTLFLRKPDA